MKHVRKTLLIIVSMVLTIALGFPVVASDAEGSASEVEFVQERIAAFGKNGRYFDYESYANTYPDLYSVFGNDKTALWNHYVTFGVYENRSALGTTPTVTAKVIALTAAASVTNSGMTDLEKAFAIHNWIVNNTRYDHENDLAGTIPDISYTKEGVFLNHTAVCAGYADAFCYLAKVVGLNCEYVEGIATNSVGVTGGHAWNRVLIDGNWLYVDCTWDDPICSDGSDMIRFMYAFIPESAMAANHRLASVYRLY